MSDSVEKDKHQQQILFDELETDLTVDKTLSTQPIIFENQDWQADNETVSLDEDYEADTASPSWLWRTILVAFAVLVTIELVDFFTVGFVESPIITSFYAVITACILTLAGTSLFRELTGIRQFKRQQELRSKVQLILSNKVGDAVSLCEQINNQLPCDVVAEKDKQWQEFVQQDYSADELLNLYSRVVLTDVDQKALAEIAKYSTESVVLIALSPVAIVDMAIILWRNFRLIDKIAGIYGLKMGYWARIRLIKHVLVNMVYAGASELIADFGTDLVGADMLGKLSGRLAQGLGAGMLTARLGLKTMSLCRPIPFDNNAPKIGSIRREIANKIKQLMLN